MTNGHINRSIREGFAVHSTDLLFALLAALLCTALFPFAVDTVYGRMRTLCRNETDLLQPYSAPRQLVCNVVQPHAVLDAVLPSWWRAYPKPLAMCANIVAAFERDVCGGGGVCRGISALMGTVLQPLSALLVWFLVVHPSRWTHEVATAVAFTVVALVAVFELSPRNSMQQLWSACGGGGGRGLFLSDWIDMVLTRAMLFVGLDSGASVGRHHRRSSGSFSGASLLASDVCVTGEGAWSAFASIDHLALAAALFTTVKLVRRVFRNPTAFHRTTIVTEQRAYYANGGLTFAQAIGNTVYYMAHVGLLLWGFVMIYDAFRSADPWLASFTRSSRDLWTSEIARDFTDAWREVKRLFS